MEDADGSGWCRYVNNFDEWRPWDCGIETDTGEHGVWACFSKHPALNLQFLNSCLTSFAAHCFGDLDGC